MLNYIQILLGLLTIIGSGVVSAVVTYRLNASRSEKEFMRKKGEELFVAIDDFYKLVFKVNFVWLSAMRGQSAYGATLQSEVKILSDKKDDHYQRLEMLASLYFHPLLAEITQFNAVKSSLNKVRFEFESAHKAEQNTQSYATQFEALLTELEARTSKLKQRLIELVRKM